MPEGILANRHLCRSERDLSPDRYEWRIANGAGPAWVAVPAARGHQCFAGVVDDAQRLLAPHPTRAVSFAPYGRLGRLESAYRVPEAVGPGQPIPAADRLDLR